MKSDRDSGCYLVYPSLAQHVVNGLAIAAQSLNLCDPDRAVPISTTSKLGGYSSPFALALDAQNADAIAQDMQRIIQDYLFKRLGYAFSISTASGWIEIQAPIEIQRRCLLHLARASPADTSSHHSLNRAPHNHSAFQILLDHQPSLARPVALDPDLIFALQYAHARCCSILRLAEQQLSEMSPIPLAWLETYLNNFVTLPELELITKLINFPQMLRNGHQWMPTELLHCDTQTATELTLVITAFPLPNKRLQALVLDWAQLFQNFYASSQIFSLTLPNSESLLTLRLTLFQALGNLTAFVLTQICQQSAPQIL